ncbi:kxDL motif-containing protein 1-like isoform X1 [Anguilla rostrata]|uniref:kxDL motif-containing protein 1-like isoform X1 n=2 Tax=Anguilla rostrata TaxID=7938 RepID=UPI0030CF6CEB
MLPPLFRLLRASLTLDGTGFGTAPELLHTDLRMAGPMAGFVHKWNVNIHRRMCGNVCAMEPTASGMFCDRMLSMVNSEDVNAIIQAQRHMLDRFEKTNEMLLNFNGLSNVRLQQMNERFLHHTRTLVEMKKDLDSVFRRIRTLKSKIAKQYPDAFSNVHESPVLEDEDDEFDPVPPSAATTTATSEQSTESCDSSPDVVSPAASRCSEEPSQEQPDTPTSDGPCGGAVLQDEGPD